MITASMADFFKPRARAEKKQRVELSSPVYLPAEGKDDVSLQVQRRKRVLRYEYERRKPAVLRGCSCSDFIFNAQNSKFICLCCQHLSFEAFARVELAASCKVDMLSDVAPAVVVASICSFWISGRLHG
jgi:hypothetical protein